MRFVYLLARGLYGARALGRLAPNAPVEAHRRAWDRSWGRVPLAGGTVVTSIDAGGVPGEWVTARGAAAGRAIVYFHGGGYTMGSPAAVRAMVSRLSRSVGVSVLSVDYRLAPEHRFPAAVEDGVAVYRWLLDEGLGPGSIALGGDSAGGGLAAAVLLSLRDAAVPLPCGAVLFSPWVDLTATAHPATNPPDPVLDDEGLAQSARAYLRDADPASPLASPVLAALGGLPPLFVQVGAADLLVGDARRFTEAARAAGTEVDLEIWPGMPHIFQMAAVVSRAARRALGDAAAFLERRWG